MKRIPTIKNSYFGRPIRLFISLTLLFGLVTPYSVLAEKTGAITLSAPESVKAFITKHFKLPTEPPADDTAQHILLRRAQQEISEILATEGYFTPTITLAHDHIHNPVITVDPGPLTKISNVHIEFQGEITQQNTISKKRIEEIQNFWPLKKGLPFRSSEWEQAKAALLSNVSQEYYAAANIVKSQAIVDPQNALVELTVIIDSGPAFYLGEMEMSGLTRYNQKLVKNFSPYRIGDPYRREVLHAFQIALQSIPHFSTVSVSVFPDITKHKSIPVQVVLTEAQSQKIALGAGFSSNNGARGELNFINHNFLNRALNWTSLLRLEQKRQTFFTGIDTLPNKNNIRYSLGAGLQMTDIENLETIRQTVGLTRNYRTEQTQRQFGLIWQREEKRPSGGMNQINSALTIDLQWRFLSVDDPLNIKQGSSTEIRIGGASQLLLSEQDFIRTYFRHQNWWPISDRDILFIRGEAGYTLAESRFGIPQEYLFRAGGIQSVRGYDFNSLGVREGNAIVGGRTSTTGTIEYTRWFTHNWGAALFSDIGSAADSWKKIDPVLGYGSGVRYRSPAGPLALDIARAHETGTFRLHFSLAVAF